jgi:hypothetical protein
MAQNGKSPFQLEEQFRIDFRWFAYAIVKHWWSFLSWTIGSGFLTFLCAYISEPANGGKRFPIWAYETALVFGLMAASFDAYRDERRRIEKITDEVRVLQAKLDDRLKRKSLKTSLAVWRETIQNLQGELNGIGIWGYHGDTRIHFERDYLSMLNTVFKFLDESIGHSEAVTFADMEKVQKVSVDPNKVWDMEEFKERWIARVFMANRLRYAAEQLEKIEEKLDSDKIVLVAN